MFTSSSAASVLPFTPGASTSAPSAPSSSDDQAQSFADVLHQHGGDSSSDATNRDSTASSSASTTDTPAANSSAPSTNPSPSAQSKAADAVVAKPVKDTAGRDAITPKKQQGQTSTPVASSPGSKPKTSGLTAGSDLAAMIVQATVLASHAGGPVAPPAATTVKGATPTTTTTAKEGAAAATTPDVGTLIAQAAALASSTTTPTAVATTAATLSTAKISTLAGREMPISPFAKPSTAVTTKEKKSSAETAERSFIQSGAASSHDDSNPLNLLSTAVSSMGYQAGNQSLTTQPDAGKNAAKDLSAAATASVGTAHVEKKVTMNELTLPEIITANGTNTASRSSADVNILLSLNSDFEDAIKQVVHIAQLSEATSSRLPNRIAIELQTPPGAIVNVYVSKQNDQYRAQLSTNDPAALSWVQDKITSLRQSNDLGVEVKWLPAQMESNPLSATTASSNDSNLNWNRDGQNPQNHQQPDERSQSQRQNQSSYEDLDGVETESFIANFATVGGVA